MKTYELIDDPLCDVEGFGSYENCEDCPCFYECMEVKEDDEPVKEVLGEDWASLMLNDWDIDRFDDFWGCCFSLDTEKVIGTEDE